MFNNFFKSSRKGVNLTTLSDAQRLAHTLRVCKASKEDLRELSFWADKYRAQKSEELKESAKSYGLSSEASLMKMWLVIQKINHDVERITGKAIEELKPIRVYTDTLREKERVILEWNKLIQSESVTKAIQDRLSNAI